MEILAHSAINTIQRHGPQAISLFSSRLPHTLKTGRQHSALCWFQVVLGQQSPWADRFNRFNCNGSSKVSALHEKSSIHENKEAQVPCLAGRRSLTLRRKQHIRFILLTVQSPTLKHYIKLVKLALPFLRRFFMQWITFMCLCNSKGVAYTRTGSFQVLRSLP